MMRIIVFLGFISLFSFVTVAEESHDQFDELAAINQPQAGYSNWQQLVLNPSNNQQHFIINKTGQMFLVDEMKNFSLVLDINVNRPVAQSPLKLTAITLHPNFSLRDQPGYGTFYTAHLEALDKQSKTKRIQENNDALMLKFDAVITEWQFNSINYQKVNVKTKREVIRIAVPSNNMTIEQMSFNPYTKSWNEGFGLLYVALNGEVDRQEPLYSGVILRINPTKFGLRSFTVPNSNPYLKDIDIRDEIYLLGAQKIKQFVWPSKSSNNLLLSHQYLNKSLLSWVNMKSDWRKSPPKNVVYQADVPIEDTLLYRGRYLPHLRNKLLILTKVNQAWLVESLHIKPSVSSVTSIENKPDPEWQFGPQQLANESNVSFSQDFNGEVLVLDKTVGKIFQLPQASVTMKKAIKASVAPAEKPTSGVYVLFLVLIALGVFIYFIKRNKTSAKAIVRTQFAQLELSESQHQIGLYHRHKNSPDIIIDIVDIATCEVMLNEVSVCVINQNAGHGFDNDKDQDLRSIFIKEKVDKMVDGKIRQISLSFTDVRNKTYDICLYMRKGSARVTKKTYSVVIEDAIDWCWLIASKINPNETAKRKEKPVIYSKQSLEATKPVGEITSLHEQAEMNRNAAGVTLKSNQGPNITSAVTPPKATVAEASNEAIVSTKQQSSIDTELVNALEKLVDLKQQGFLTQEEFTKAKENLLSSLFDK
jgi:hypothetical protein